MWAQWWVGTDRLSVFITQPSILNILNNEPDILFVSSCNADDIIETEVRVYCDAEQVDVNLQQAENRLQAWLGEENVYVIYSLGVLTFPTVAPAILPTSSVPSSPPTITGDVVPKQRNLFEIIFIHNDILGDIMLQ